MCKIIFSRFNSFFCGLKAFIDWNSQFIHHWWIITVWEWFRLDLNQTCRNISTVEIEVPNWDINNRMARHNHSLTQRGNYKELSVLKWRLLIDRGQTSEVRKKYVKNVCLLLYFIYSVIITKNKNDLDKCIMLSYTYILDFIHTTYKNMTWFWFVTRL